nr:Chain J, Spike glycoprotein E2 [Sindbis virus]1Z8Y_L Chain L, Spike glycoprotein E2 [Sindbis virus]1Z8Y_N Chain N, Spike glycoprotein E2 [Sindbis virus]1Z8Y_P Chain P, Spike glycoprotein E2 [Sindbis virus]
HPVYTILAVASATVAMMIGVTVAVLCACLARRECLT